MVITNRLQLLDRGITVDITTVLHDMVNHSGYHSQIITQELLFRARLSYNPHEVRS